MAYKKG